MQRKGGNDLQGAADFERCPLGLKIYAKAQEEFDAIRLAHRTLTSTGCTPHFCQSGRATKTHEARVGRDRPLEEIQREAEEFLRECRDMNVIKTDEQLDERIKQALGEIAESSLETTTAHADGHVGMQLAGGAWHQTYEELEYGVRASWRNSRRCIARSEHEHLGLCDLRHIQTSRAMAATLMKELQKAFNNGRILPTAFVFPPRQPGKRGPMIWNEQILAFAGYKRADGSVLGDPKSVDLTEAIIQLGWKAPSPRTRWDILPLVTMAEGERPFMTELPDDLKRLVKITHPRYGLEFEELDLRWVLFPALSRLGFDIGGVQYTASPFIGWFMDAEVGVRNLADSFRYNALPDVVRLLRLSDKPDKPLADLPGYQSMVALSRAQAELNYAVYHSYLHDHVMMVDTMTSSLKFQQYDDQRKEELGYRLPTDPYWLAPPQGSIVPLWHRGAAPNYQPKPLVARHVQNPIKAWRREFPAEDLGSNSSSIVKHCKGSHGRLKIMIFVCSAGITAAKLATRLSTSLQRLSQEFADTFELAPVRSLNALVVQDCDPNDILLIVASTTGRGEVPRNAKKFIKRHCGNGKLSTSPRYSIYANGDSTYGDSYNAAANEVEEIMVGLGCHNLLDHVFAGDTAMHNPDWASFNHWIGALDHRLRGQEHKIDLPSSFTELDKPTALAEMPAAVVVEQKQMSSNGLILLTLDIGDSSYQEMDHVKILTPNRRANVAEVLRHLHLSNDTRFTWHYEDAFTFMNRYVDLEYSFKTLDWYPGIDLLSEAERQALSSKNVLEVLNTIDIVDDADMVEKICKDMASISPRLYSVASSPAYEDGVAKSGRNRLQILVKVNEKGRFSKTFLSQAQPGYGMRFGLTSPDTWKIISAQKPGAPLIAFVTGSGIGPVRALLQHRMADLTRTSASVPQPRPLVQESSVSVAGSVDVRSQLKSKAKAVLLTLAESSCSNVAAPLTAAPVASLNSSRVGSRRPSISSIGDLSISSSRTTSGACTNHRAHHSVGSTKSTISLFVGFSDHDQAMIEHLIKPAKELGIFDIFEMCPSNPAKIRIQDHMIKPEVERALLERLSDPACIVFVCANGAAANACVQNLSGIYGQNIKEALGERYIEEVFRG